MTEQVARSKITAQDMRARISVQIGSSTDWVEVAAGENFSLARKTNNTLP